MQAIEPEILPLGPDGLLLRFATVADPQVSAAVQTLLRKSESAPLTGVTEVVPALASIFYRFDANAASRAEVTEHLRALVAGEDWDAVARPAPARIWRIPVAFGGDHGPGLAEAATLAGIDAAEAVRQIEAAELSVLAIGFAPGQPYLGLLPEHWNLPRQEALTPKVGAGALVVAVRQLVLFANPSPTGWRQIGLTAFRPFRPEASEPVPLRTGDVVRFAAVGAGEMDALLAAGDPAGGAVCETAR